MLIFSDFQGSCLISEILLTGRGFNVLKLIFFSYFYNKKSFLLRDLCFIPWYYPVKTWFKSTGAFWQSIAFLGNSVFKETQAPYACWKSEHHKENIHLSLDYFFSELIEIISQQWTGSCAFFSLLLFAFLHEEQILV